MRVRRLEARDKPVWLVLFKGYIAFYKATVPEDVIEAVYAEADARGCTRTYWTTQEFNYPARTLYDSVATKSVFVQYRR